MGKDIQQDPLHEILERHLFTSSTEGGKSDQMIQAVVNDYLLYLKAKSTHIPSSVKAVFIEDLKVEIREFIIKRTFGAVMPETPKPEAEIKQKSFNKKDA
jgi:hypothetical protein